MLEQMGGADILSALETNPQSQAGEKEEITKFKAEYDLERLTTDQKAFFEANTEMLYNLYKQVERKGGFREVVAEHQF